MQLRIYGKGIKVSDYLEGIVEKKARKLERYFTDDTEVIIKLSIEKSRHIAEVTVPFFDGTLLRTEESSGDMYGSIDAALKKLERMIRKHRTRLEKGLREQAYDDVPVLLEEVEEDFEVMNLGKLVRNKSFVLKPMEIDEAIAQMELLGHSFFMFLRTNSGEVAVVYKRTDGDYGIIEPEYA